MKFPENFKWGVATAAYQIEGAPYKAGGGYTVWDMFCRRPGAINDNSNGDIACDHFNRFREDVKLMADLGIPNYRLSISWPRVIPDGTGAIHQAGLDFYDQLIDELVKHNIDPHVTLFHWDLPYETYVRGGWLNRDIVGWFTDYSEVIVDKLGDRVGSWMTLNEPQCFIGLGQQTALHAPGDKLNFAEVLRAGHHCLLAHGAAVQVIRAHATNNPLVGYAPVGVVKYPASSSEADINAARESMFSIAGKDVWNNTWWMDPVFFGEYPADGLEMFKEDLPPIIDGDLELINQPLDFFGANIYNGQIIKAGEKGPEQVPHELGIGRTIYHWPLTPESLYWGPKFFYERYGKPIVVTENGLGLSDWVQLDGKVHDPQRIDFLQRYLRAFGQAGLDGTEIMGYFQWSFMDNFEWYEGYKHRFGLIHVNYQTQVRTPKDSAYWYKDVIASNGEIV